MLKQQFPISRGFVALEFSYHPVACLLGRELNRCWGKKLLKGPASRKPSALSKRGFPGQLGRLVVTADGRSRNIGQIDVACSRITIPAKHRVDNLGELSVVRFVDATCVHPKVLPAMLSCLFSAEPDLVIPSLVPACIIYHIFESDFLCSPCM